jgi:hypothetical protein
VVTAAASRFDLEPKLLLSSAHFITSHVIDAAIIRHVSYPRDLIYLRLSRCDHVHHAQQIEFPFSSKFHALGHTFTRNNVYGRQMGGMIIRHSRRWTDFTTCNGVGFVGFNVLTCTVLRRSPHTTSYSPLSQSFGFTARLSY